MNLMDKQLLLLLRKKRQEAFSNPDSVLKEYYEYLEIQGVYPSLSSALLEKNLKGHYELCDKILELYKIAKLDNERFFLLENLWHIGYDKVELVKLILSVFFSENRPSNLWKYGDLLFLIKKQEFLSQYLTIIKDKTYGTARQMIVLLVGKSKNNDVIPTLISLLTDKEVYGHALSALSNFHNEEVRRYMLNYTDDKNKWIKEIAITYIDRY